MAYDGRPASHYGSRDNERLRVQCWCTKRFGSHPAAEVRRGRTFSCSPKCKPPGGLGTDRGQQDGSSSL